MDFLDLEAYLGGEFLHPGGRAVTELLLRELRLLPAGLTLELGGGTGATASLLARELGVPIVTLDMSSAMLDSAQGRLQDEGVGDLVHLAQADAGHTLPFVDAAFDVAYAESVVALLDAERVIGECFRVLCPGGHLALTERIWKSGVPQALVDEINTLSSRLFGVPAGTSEPLDRDDWLRVFHRAGSPDVCAVHVGALGSSPHFIPNVRRWLSRGTRYLARPGTLLRSLWFKVLMHRHRTLSSHMECYFFLARKSRA